MVKILRLIEYTYKDALTMDEDMAAWGVPARGSIRLGEAKKIKSTILDPDFSSEEDPID